MYFGVSCPPLISHVLLVVNTRSFEPNSLRLFKLTSCSFGVQPTEPFHLEHVVKNAYTEVNFLIRLCGFKYIVISPWYKNLSMSPLLIHDTQRLLEIPKSML